MGTEIKKIEINDGMKKMIENNALSLASIDKTNKPHSIAVGFVKVVSKNQLLISDNYLKDTLENIKNNKNVSLVVWERDWEENCIGYELNGTAEYFKEGKWVEEIKKIPVNEGAPCKGALIITLNKMKVLD